MLLKPYTPPTSVLMTKLGQQNNTASLLHWDRAAPRSWRDTSVLLNTPLSIASAPLCSLGEYQKQCGLCVSSFIASISLVLMLFQILFHIF